MSALIVGQKIKKYFQQIIDYIETIIININSKYKKDNSTITQEINSLLIAMFLSTNIIGFIIPINGISVIFTILILVAFIFNNGIKNILSKEKLIVLICIAIWFILSILTKNGNFNNVIEYLKYFVVFVPVAFIISDKEFYNESVYKYIMLLSILAIPYFIINNFLNYSYSIQEQSQVIMVVSYALLPVIISCINIIFSNNMKKYYKIISIIPLLIYSFIILSISSRGPILAIGVYFILKILCYKPKENRKKIKIAIIVILIISAIIGICFMKEILTIGKNILNFFSIDSKPIDRMISSLNNNGDPLSGRARIYGEALKDIPKSFIFGNGIGTFEDKYGHYVHNIVLQIIYEGGIICISYFIYLMYNLVKLLIKQPKEKVDFLIFLISISLVQLMISSFYWSSLKFWILIGYTIYLKQKNAKEVNKNETI